jgi:hypothetical protein
MGKDKSKKEAKETVAMEIVQEGQMEVDETVVRLDSICAPKCIFTVRTG